MKGESFWSILGQIGELPDGPQDYVVDVFYMLWTIDRLRVKTVFWALPLAILFSAVAGFFVGGANPQGIGARDILFMGFGLMGVAYLVAVGMLWLFVFGLRLSRVKARLKFLTRMDEEYYRALAWLNDRGNFGIFWTVGKQTGACPARNISRTEEGG